MGGTRPEPGDGFNSYVELRLQGARKVGHSVEMQHEVSMVGECTEMRLRAGCISDGKGGDLPGSDWRPCCGVKRCAPAALVCCRRASCLHENGQRCCSASGTPDVLFVFRYDVSKNRKTPHDCLSLQAGVPTL